MDSPFIFNRLSYKIFTMDTSDIIQKHTISKQKKSHQKKKKKSPFFFSFFKFIRKNLNENQGQT